jgi:hypothetical protein
LTTHSIATRFGYRQGAREAEADGARLAVLGRTEADGQRQNIFVRVFSWTWISSPMTGSQLTARSLVGTRSEPERALERVPARKSLFSANCGPTSWSPTGRPSENPHGTLRPGSRRGRRES